jgi:hypothetical protein
VRQQYNFHDRHRTFCCAHAGDESRLVLATLRRAALQPRSLPRPANQQSPPHD